jgi:hypothetical protein
VFLSCGGLLVSFCGGDVLVVSVTLDLLAAIGPGEEITQGTVLVLFVVC